MQFKDLKIGQKIRATSRGGPARVGIIDSLDEGDLDSNDRKYNSATIGFVLSEDSGHDKAGEAVWCYPEQVMSILQNV